MSGKTKILVLHMKEVIYTGIFLFLGFIFLVLLAVMFLPGQSDTEAANTEASSESLSDPSDITPRYTPGIYTATLEVSGNSLELQVILEQSGITDVSFTRPDEAIETMYPLFTPVLESIAEQLKNGIALEDVAYDDSQKYTAGVLLNAIKEVLEKAAE